MIPSAKLWIFCLLVPVSAAAAVDARIQGETPISTLPNVPPSLAAPISEAALSGTGVSLLAAPAMAVPLAAAPMGAATLSAAPGAAESPLAAPAASPAGGSFAAAAEPTAAGAGPAAAGAATPARPKTLRAHADQSSLAALRAEWEALQGQLRETPPAVDASGVSAPARGALATLMSSFRQATAAKPDGIADVRAARLAAASAAAGLPVQGFVADYVEARGLGVLGVDPENAARLAAAAAASGTSIRSVLSSYRGLLVSPHAIAPERAARLTAAAVADGRSVAGVGDEYVRVRAAVDSAAQDAALRLTLTSEILDVPSGKLLALYRAARSSLGAYGGSDAASRLVAGAAVAAVVTGRPLDDALMNQMEALYRQALVSKPESIEPRRAARLAAAAAVSGWSMADVAADYRAARDSRPYGIDQDRASVLTVASALSGAPIGELIATYQETRDPLKGRADPEGAVVIASATALNARQRGILFSALDLLTDD